MEKKTKQKYHCKVKFLLGGMTALSSLYQKILSNAPSVFTRHLSSGFAVSGGKEQSMFPS